MSSTESVPQTLEQLRQSAMDMPSTMEDKLMHKHHHENGYTNGYGYGPFGYAILAFLVTLLLLFLFRPQIVLSEDCDCGDLVFDWGKALVWSLGVGLVVLVIAYIAQRGNRRM